MTLNNTVLTLADFAKRLDPTGKTATIVELLSQTNEILTDMKWMEGNLPTGHRTTVRTGLPTVYWRLLNQGVQPSKSTTVQIDEGLGMLEAWSEIDVDLASLNGNTNEFRLSEGAAFVEAMNIEMASTLFYGNASVSPEEFNGLSVRYSTKAGAANGKNIILGGGASTDNTSIWLVVWGPNTIHGIFPKGSKAGLVHQNKGIQTVENAGGVTGAKMDAYRDKWQWKCGIALRDWRFVARAPNIDVSNLAAGVSAADIFEIMVKMIHAIGPAKMKMGTPVFYMNSTVFSAIDIQQTEKVSAGGGVKYDNVDGQVKYSFRGIPIRLCDAILENEALVS